MNWKDGMELHFTKLSANGNDFVALDNREGLLHGGEVDLIRYLCDRRRGAGADGLLLVEEEPTADFRMRIFNPDGSEARMCGNGARACAHFAASLGLGRAGELSFITRAGLQRAKLDGQRSRLWLSAPEARGLGEDTLRADHELWAAWPGLRLAGFVRMGVPHLVVEMEEGIDGLSLSTIGPLLRYHKAYAPEGTNVMVAQRMDSHRLNLRAWEKGVEEETWGCGTGAVAACLILQDSRELGWPHTVHMLGGDLTVYREDGVLSFAGEIHEAFQARAEVPDSLLNQANSLQSI
jgi:diaminopimelate epimerase